MAFDRWHGTQSIQIHANHGKNRINGRDAVRSATYRRSRWFFDVCDVGSHLGPNRDLRNFGDFLSEIRVLSHL